MATAKKGTAKSGEDTPRRTRNTQKYIRNLHGSPASVRLQAGRRIELAPRGMRGDLSPITKDEQNDPNLVINVGLLFELINHAEAAEVIGKQATNMQAVHPALALIGQEDVEMEVLLEDQGVAVAPLKDGNVVIQPGRQGGIVRSEGEHVGPRVSAAYPGSSTEMANLMGADEAAKNNTDLTSILGGFTIS